MCSKHPQLRTEFIMVRLVIFGIGVFGLFGVMKVDGGETPPINLLKCTSTDGLLKLEFENPEGSVQEEMNHIHNNYPDEKSRKQMAKLLWVWYSLHPIKKKHDDLIKVRDRMNKLFVECKDYYNSKEKNRNVNEPREEINILGLTDDLFKASRDLQRICHDIPDLKELTQLFHQDVLENAAVLRTAGYLLHGYHGDHNFF